MALGILECLRFTLDKVLFLLWPKDFSPKEVEDMLGIKISEDYSLTKFVRQIKFLTSGCWDKLLVLSTQKYFSTVTHSF